MLLLVLYWHMCARKLIRITLTTLLTLYPLLLATRRIIVIVHASEEKRYFSNNGIEAKGCIQLRNHWHQTVSLGTRY